MNYIIQGHFCAYLCRDCREDLSQVTVRLYRPDGNATDRIVSDPKETLQVLDEKAVKAKAKRLLAEASTNQQGNFTFKLNGEKQKYNGEAVEVDVLVKSVPNQKKQKKKHDPVQFTITVWQPKWRERTNDLVAVWDYCLSARFWCGIRSLFDAWVICGRIVDCENKQQPVIGVKVTAFDADWLQDDKLGSATTDSTGHFRIDYTSIDFKQTFLSPVINVETPFPPFNSGPDVYFTVESGGGTPLLEETRSDGKQGSRKDIGHCFCIELCVEGPEEDDDDLFASAWVGIGSALIIPDGSGLNDFDSEGHAVTGGIEHALTGTIQMTGQAPRTQNGNPLEYRFRISETPSTNGTAPLPESAFTKTVGVDAGLFANTYVGQMWRYNPTFKIVKIIATQADIDADGWLDVNKSILRTFTDDPTLNPSELSTPGLWQWVDRDELMAIDTNALTSVPDVPDGVAEAGEPVPVANRLDPTDIEKVAIRFEIREVIDKPNGIFSFLPGSGQTLNALVINNNKAFMKIALKEHLTSGNSCDGLGGEVHTVFTVNHQFLEDVSVRVRSNNGAVNKSLTDTFVPLVNNNSNANHHHNNNNLKVGDATDLIKCAYRVTLTVQRRLHTGNSKVLPNHVDTLFCYMP